MESPDPRRNLIVLAEARKVSLAALSRMIGKNGSYLHQFLYKGSPRKLEETDRATLARFFGVDEAELGAPQDKYHDLARAEWIDVPRLMVGASAGPGARLDEEGAFDAIRFSGRWLRSMGLRANSLSAITVSGDSMEPTLRDGDEILVDCSGSALRDGIHVVRLEGTVLVKRMDTGRPGRIVLLSDNPAYQPIECGAGEVQVVGRVVWKGGRI
ncbi:S24 family peptidase [Novosphingobium album (ex Hu et al. 2023)]|uniref:Transcriptional regulator n=1 Tax=Novosphingobium album (ex Hu et al. 2023) TaxID=2930093 RepID=A0ABT0AYP0_9SPHN|nr:LexA family transcriptional regulator [Novosphingobium album (ex Hu et al. 2023)]MCJ2177912.1 transcriptional regulator [Novosphingobium album (ex Hu et al. 2023)]